MSVKVIKSISDSDGFFWLSFEVGYEEVGNLHACIANQKNFEGTTLRVRRFAINDGDETPFLRMKKVFGALFKWNEANNMKFYIDTKELFLGLLFLENYYRKKGSLKV